MPDPIKTRPLEVPFPGGMGSGDAVVRVGDTVRRPVRPHTGAVASFLGHLETVGLRSRAQSGLPADVRVWNAGYAEQNRRSRAWLDDHAEALSA